MLKFLLQFNKYLLLLLFFYKKELIITSELFSKYIFDFHKKKWTGMDFSHSVQMFEMEWTIFNVTLQISFIGIDVW